MTRNHKLGFAFMPVVMLICAGIYVVRPTDNVLVLLLIATIIFAMWPLREFIGWKGVLAGSAIVVAAVALLFSHQVGSEHPTFQQLALLMLIGTTVILLYWVADARAQLVSGSTVGSPERGRPSGG